MVEKKRLPACDEQPQRCVGTDKPTNSTSSKIAQDEFVMSMRERFSQGSASITGLAREAGWTVSHTRKVISGSRYRHLPVLPPPQLLLFDRTMENV
jgi:hypothetical protein